MHVLVQVIVGKRGGLSPARLPAHRAWTWRSSHRRAHPRAEGPEETRSRAEGGATPSPARPCERGEGEERRGPACDQTRLLLKGAHRLFSIHSRGKDRVGRAPPGCLWGSRCAGISPGPGCVCWGGLRRSQAPTLLSFEVLNPVPPPNGRCLPPKSLCLTLGKSERGMSILQPWSRDRSDTMEQVTHRTGLPLSWEKPLKPGTLQS